MQNVWFGARASFSQMAQMKYKIAPRNIRVTDETQLRNRPYFTSESYGILGPSTKSPPDLGRRYATLEHGKDSYDALTQEAPVKFINEPAAERLTQ